MIQNFNANRSNGLSILELSVSLVIIAIITSTIVFGRSLMHRAAISKFLSDVMAYKTLIHVFYNTFGCLPGDCNEKKMPLNIVDNIRAQNLFCFDNPTIGNGKINSIAKSSCAFRELREFDPKTFYNADILDYMQMKWNIADLFLSTAIAAGRRVGPGKGGGSTRSTSSPAPAAPTPHPAPAAPTPPNPPAAAKDPIIDIADQIRIQNPGCSAKVRLITNDSPVTIIGKKCQRIPNNINECINFLSIRKIIQLNGIGRHMFCRSRNDSSVAFISNEKSFERGVNISIPSLKRLYARCLANCNNITSVVKDDIKNDNPSVYSGDHYSNFNRWGQSTSFSNICRDKDIPESILSNRAGQIASLIQDVRTCRQSYEEKINSIRRLLASNGCETLKEQLDKMSRDVENFIFSEISQEKIESCVNERIPNIPDTPETPHDRTETPDDHPETGNPSDNRIVDPQYIHDDTYPNVNADTVKPLLNIGQVNRENNPLHLIEGAIGMFKLITVCDPNTLDIGSNSSCTGIEPYENGRGLYRDNIGSLMLIFTAEHAFNVDRYIDKGLVSSKMAHDMDCKVDDCSPSSGYMIAGKDCNMEEGSCLYAQDGRACTTAHGSDWNSVASFENAEYVGDNGRKKCIISFKILSREK